MAANKTILAGLTAMLSGVSFLIARSHQSQDAVTRPMTIHQVFKTFGDDGSVIRETRVTVHYNSKGARAAYFNRTGERFPAPHEIADPDAGFAWHVDPLGQTYAGMRLLKPELTLMRQPPACEEKYGKGSCIDAGAIAGFQTVRAVHKIPPYETELYMAPDLNNRRLRQVTRKDGKLTIVMDTESVMLGEPPANLFKIPDGFKRLSNTDHFASVAKARGEAVCEGCDKSLDDRERLRTQIADQ